jgi:hypothetical protein
VSLIPHARFYALENRSYFGEFEAEIKKALARESGAQGVPVLFYEKKPEGRKSRDTVPLNVFNELLYRLLLYIYIFLTNQKKN